MSEPPKKCAPGLPAWLATFGDLMSLLLCFFVLLLSFAEMDAQKFRIVAESMKKAFGVQRDIPTLEIPKGTSIIKQHFSPAIPEPTPMEIIQQQTIENTDPDLESPDTEGEISKKAREIEQIILESLREEIENGKIDIERKDKLIIIRLEDKALFAPGSDVIKQSFLYTLDNISRMIEKQKAYVEVGGHTDNQPISNLYFRSNWELSAARAVSVLQELILGTSLSPEHFKIIGYADSRPLAKNNNNENRSKNRRVELIINTEKM